MASFEKNPLRQSRAFPLLEMFWSADQNKQLSNQSATLESPDARPVFMRFHNSWWSSQIWMQQSSNIYSQYLRLLLPEIGCLQKHGLNIF